MIVKPLEIYEINTFTWLEGLSQKFHRSIGLATVPEAEWDRIEKLGFDAVWLMGVWERSPAARAINEKDPEFVQAMSKQLPDFDFQNDIAGSAYSIREYKVSETFGGATALATARATMKQHGLKLILDYVPNHVAPDHPWATSHPEYFIQGTQNDLDHQPAAFMKAGSAVIARGRDPNFPPWSDVLQLNAFSPQLREACGAMIRSIAAQCDGLRCDMAMLFLNAIFSSTWPDQSGPPPAQEFWSDIIESTRQIYPTFLFIAESYWNTEQQLLKLGFDYCYDKHLYDYLQSNNTDAIRKHLSQPVAYQNHLLRFLENHDEPRAAHSFPAASHKAAAVLLATIPGAHLYYDGQLDGETVRTPVHLKRELPSVPDQQLKYFYAELMPVLRRMEFNPATWQLCRINNLAPLRLHSKKTLFAHAWQGKTDIYLALINYSGRNKRAKVSLPRTDSSPASVKFEKLFDSRPEAKSYIKLPSGRLVCRLAGFQAIIVKLKY